MSSLQLLCDKFNPAVETVEEFISRFKVQRGTQLREAEASSSTVPETGNKMKVELLCLALPVNIITDLQRRIKPIELHKAKFDDIIQHLNDQFSVKKSELAARRALQTRNQEATESIETFAKVINDLASKCNYKPCCRDSIIRDAFIMGLSSNLVLKGLIKDNSESKSFKECVEKAKLIQQLATDAIDIRPEMARSQTFKVSPVSNTTKKIKAGYVCFRCGAKAEHFVNECFAINMMCKKCGKIGHLAKVCRARNIHSLEQSTDDVTNQLANQRPFIDEGNVFANQYHGNNGWAQVAATNQQRNIPVSSLTSYPSANQLQEYSRPPSTSYNWTNGGTWNLSSAVTSQPLLSTHAAYGPLPVTSLLQPTGLVGGPVKKYLPMTSSSQFTSQSGGQPPLPMTSPSQFTSQSEGQLLMMSEERKNQENSEVNSFLG